MSNKGLLLRQNMVNIANAIRNNGGSILPKEYTELEYIESTGTQYIDTGVKAKHTMVFETIVARTVYANTVFWGSRNEGTYQSENNQCYLNWNSSNIKMFSTNVNDARNWDSGINPNEEEFCHFKNITCVDTMINSNYSIYLFALNNQGTTTVLSSCRIGLFKVVDNSILIANFIPCYRKSDNVIGLYDTVNNVFYTNQGTGTFIKGPEVASQFKPREMAQGIDNLADLLRSYIPHRAITGNPLSVDAIALKPKEIFPAIGDTKQDTTTGKNKLNIDDLLAAESEIYASVTFTHMLNLIVKPNTTYTLSSNVNGSMSGSASNRCLYLCTNNETIAIFNEKSQSYSTGETGLIKIGFISGRTYSSEIENKTAYIQLEEGSTATPYEPYTGGKASPNPDFKQDVRTVKAKNWFDEIVYKDNYIILSDGTEQFNSLGCIWNFFKVKPNTTYTLSYESLDLTFANRVSEYTNNKTFIKRSVTYAANFTFTTSENTEYINISGLKTNTNTQVIDGTLSLKKTGKNLFNPLNFITKNNVSCNQNGILTSTAISSNAWSYANSNYKITLPAGTYSITCYFDTKESSNESAFVVLNTDNSRIDFVHTTNLEIATTSFNLLQETDIGIMFKLLTGVCKVQIEEGTTAIAYEPYKSVTIPFNIGNTEFCKIGNLADKLWVNLRTGEYGKTSNIKNVVFNGSEPYIGWHSAGNNFSLVLSQSGVRNNVICNYYKAGDSSHVGEIDVSFNGLNIYIHQPNENINSVELLKGWLSTHNLETYYQLATPTTETLGTLSATDLANLCLYAGVNNIALEGYEDNGTEPIIELDYYYDYNES